jgi:hypothetical protein
MRYDLELIESQLIRTLQSNPSLQSVFIRTHIGDVTPQTFLDPAMREGFITQLPFIYVQYQGRRRVSTDSTLKTCVFSLRFRFYIGASSLSAKRDAQLNAYQMLSSLFDSIHGKIPKAVNNQSWSIPMLDGDVIQTPFTSNRPFEVGEGNNELLLVNMPKICVYQSDYQVEAIA